LFLDPGFDAVLEPITPAPGRSAADVGPLVERWDGTDLAKLSGTYGDYLLGKVSKVFPGLSCSLQKADQATAESNSEP
jgi:hypothetical protein